MSLALLVIASSAPSQSRAVGFLPHLSGQEVPVSALQFGAKYSQTLGLPCFSNVMREE